MQAAGTTAKQINVIVVVICAGKRFASFGEKKVSCPWKGEESSRERILLLPCIPLLPPLS